MLGSNIPTLEGLAKGSGSEFPTSGSACFRLGPTVRFSVGDPDSDLFLSRNISMWNNVQPILNEMMQIRHAGLIVVVPIFKNAHRDL
jgi:hypothetical protein